MGFCADSGYCHSPRGKKSVINGRGDSNAPIPRCVLRFPRHIMRQIQNIQKLTCLVLQTGCSGSRARASPHLCAETAAMPQENGGQCRGAKWLLKHHLCYALPEYNSCSSRICTVPTGTSTVKSTECKAAQEVKEWK